MIQRTAIRQVGPDDAGMKISREEFSAVDFQEPYQYERVRGRLVVAAPRDHERRNMSRSFRRELYGYWGRHRQLIDDVDVEGWVATSEDDDRIPDICVYLAGENSDQRVPDIVFEFVSKSRHDQERDYIFNRAEYHAVGVKEYVIVDRFKQSVLVLAWQADDYAEQTLAGDAEYTSPLLPGLKVSLQEVFAE